MHHVVLERWSRGISPLHRRDPRAKLAALMVFLVVLATAHRAPAATAVALFLLPVGALFAARLPVAAALARAAVVLPFTGLFAVASWLGGEPGRGLALILKSYLSALAVLAVVSTTPMTVLLRGLEAAGAPAFLLTVAQFLYRYLFVISEEAQHMHKAALSRGGSFGFRGAAGALAVLFARSYERAGEIHRAMLARGFGGSFRTAATLHFRTSDALFATGAAVATVLLRLAAERLA